MIQFKTIFVLAALPLVVGCAHSKGSCAAHQKSEVSQTETAVAQPDATIPAAAAATTEPEAKAAVAEAAPVEKTGCESCKRGTAGETLWCGHCGKGFVDGKVMKCQGCYKAKTEGASPCTGCAKAKTAH